MSWQFIIAFLMAAIPAGAWILGQVMESRLAKQGFSQVEEVEQPMKDKLLVFLAGLGYLGGMELTSLGLINGSSLFTYGVISYLLALLFSYKAGVFRILFKG